MGKRLSLLLATCVLCQVLTGCSYAPESEEGKTSSAAGAIPQRVSEAYALLSQKQYEVARLRFLEALQASQVTASEMSLVMAGMGFCNLWIHGPSKGLPDFDYAFSMNPANPEARLGLAIELAWRGADGDCARAAEMLEGLEAGNADFTYPDRFQLGIGNAKVHALLAYAYEKMGNTAKAETQRAIASALDASIDTAAVAGILTTLAPPVAQN